MKRKWKENGFPEGEWFLLFCFAFYLLQVGGQEIEIGFMMKKYDYLRFEIDALYILVFRKVKSP